MTYINHSEVSIGKRHGVNNLQYANASNRRNGTNELNGIVLTADHVHQIAYQVDYKSYWVLTNHSPITWDQILVGFTAPSYGLRIINENGGFVVIQDDPIELADDAYIDLPDETWGFGKFVLSSALPGGGIEFGDITWSATGIPLFIANSTNAVLADTDTKFAIFDNGTNVRVRNRLGLTQLMVYEFFYGYPVP